MKAGSSLIFAVVAGAAVLAAIFVGLMIIGPPATVRAQRLDEQRVRNLQAIATSVNGYQRAHGTLPDSLEAIQKTGEPTYWRLKDPETGLPYEYRVKDAFSYELCAQFDAPSDDTVAARTDAISPFRDQFWNHKQGRQCFSIEARAPKQP